MSSMQPIPPAIEHLDFDPEKDQDHVVEEKNEPRKDKTCGLGKYHPYDKDDMQACGRKAVYVIAVCNKPCGHTNHQVYLCRGCWNEVQANYDTKHWTCRHYSKESGGLCDTAFLVKTSITRWEMI